MVTRALRGRRNGVSSSIEEVEGTGALEYPRASVKQNVAIRKNGTRRISRIVTTWNVRSGCPRSGCRVIERRVWQATERSHRPIGPLHHRTDFEETRIG